MRKLWKSFIGLFKKKKTRQDRADEVKTNIEVGKLYPLAQFIPDLPKLKTNAKMRSDKYIIHHTAGWQNQSARSFFENFLKRGLCTDFMDENGQIWIQRDHDRSGSHIGKAKLNGKKISTRGIGGIEIAAAGKLEKRGDRYFTWYNQEIPKHNMRYVTKEMGYNSEGYFQKLTEKQEKSLVHYMVYLLKTHPEMELLQHSDVSGYRGKTDLDGSLSLPMKEFIRQKVMPLV